METKPATGRGRSPLNRDHIDLAFRGAGLWGFEQIICHLVVSENGKYQFMAILVGMGMMVVMMISLKKTHSANGLKHLET